MPEIGFGISSKGTLLEALNAIPSDYRTFFLEGFARLSALEAPKRETVLSAARVVAPFPNELELEPIKASLGLERTEVGALLSVCRLLMGVLAFRNESPRDLVNAAIAANILRQEDAANVLAFAESIGRHRSEYRKSLVATSLQHVLLPSLTNFDVKVDLRLEFEGGKISAAAPVAVVHVDTDTSEKELWFQMSRSQVIALQNRLKVAEWSGPHFDRTIAA